MLDHTFQRRREIERMLLSGKRLTVPYLMSAYSVGKNAIRRDFDVIGEELPVIVKRGYNGGYYLLDGVGKHQNSLSHEQLECLEEVAEDCTERNREILLSIIHEFGPYCEKNTQILTAIEDTKTTSGTRIIPMTDEVFECFKRIVANRKKPKIEPMIDGYSGLLFLDKKDMPEVALHWEKHFEWALNKHNRIYKEQLPKITPHVCRHTYCSNMAKSGMNPKTLQFLMGHSDIGVTLNTYTHLGLDDAREELERIGRLA